MLAEFAASSRVASRPEGTRSVPSHAMAMLSRAIQRQMAKSTGRLAGIRRGARRLGAYR